MRRDGFSLIEISIVLVVVATMLAGVLPAITESQKTRAADETAKRVEAIEQAVLSFRMDKDRIPCPSDNTLGINTQNFGREATPEGDCKDGTAIDANFPATAADTADTIMGGVPTKTLGLPDEYAFDGWGRRFDYYVDKRLTLSATFLSQTDEGSIQVNDSSNNPRSATDIKGAAYALVSHGPNGHGAYTRAGVRFSFGTTNSHEQENCDCNATTATTTYDSVLVQKMAMPSSNVLESYDDIVRYTLRPQLDPATGAAVGDCTGIAPSGWPDAIKCNDGTYDASLYFSYDAGTHIQYARPFDSSATRAAINYTKSTKAFMSQLGLAGYDCVTASSSITQLEADGKTFSFCGGSGGGWVDVPPTDTADFDLGCAYRLKLEPNTIYYAGFIRADLIRADNIQSSGIDSSFQVLKASKGTYSAKLEGGAVYTGSFPLFRMEKNCGGGGGGGGEGVLLYGGSYEMYGAGSGTQTNCSKFNPVTSDCTCSSGYTGRMAHLAIHNCAGNVMGTCFTSLWMCEATGGGGGGSSLWTASGTDISNSNAGNVGVGTAAPQSKLDVAGDVRIGNTAAACTAAKAGAMRYSAGAMQFCDGAVWGPIGMTYLGTCSPATATSVTGGASVTTACTCGLGETLMMLTYNYKYDEIGSTGGNTGAEGVSACRVVGQNSAGVRGEAYSDAFVNARVSTHCSFACFAQ